MNFSSSTRICLLWGLMVAADVSVDSTCGKGEEVVSTNCLGDSLVKSQARATAKMVIGGCCTAWLVKNATADRGALMLTTGHCSGQDTASFIFDYVAPCGSTSGGSQNNKCAGKRISAEGSKDEQGIYELEKPCVHADTATPILLDIGIPDVGEGMYLIGHPMCRPQVLSHQEVHDEGHHCVIRDNNYNRGGSRRARYYCDTQGGNSGSPVFSARTGHAFAIHSHGGCNGNKNSANSGGMLANSGVVAAFNQFGIPFVDRSKTDIAKFEEFVEESKCVVHSQSTELSQKSLAQCKSLCVNSLICVGIEYSASQSNCSIKLRSSAMPDSCKGDSKYFRRVRTLTKTLFVESTTTTTPEPLTPASGFCGFESSARPYCGIWHQNTLDEFDWTRKSGGTPSSSTGPNKAHGGSYYLYTEVSSPIQNNDQAVLEALTPTLKPGAFLSFFYHMKGNSMGALKVKAQSKATGKTHNLWAKSGNQGNDWIQETISLDKFVGDSLVISFVGNKGSSFAGDIAIDDVTLSAEPGTGTTTTVTTVTTSTATTTTASQFKMQIREFGGQGCLKSQGGGKLLQKNVTGGCATFLVEGERFRSLDVPGQCLDYFGGRSWGLWNCHGGANQKLHQQNTKWCFKSHCIESATLVTTTLLPSTSLPGSSSTSSTSPLTSTTTTTPPTTTITTTVIASTATTTIMITTITTTPPTTHTASTTSTAATSNTTTTTSSLPDDADILQSGDAVFLSTRSGNGNMIDVESTGSTVQARWVARGNWQAIVVEKRDGGVIHSGDIVYLKTHSDTHIDASGETLQNRWKDHGLWQEMRIQKRFGNGAISSKDIVCFRAHTGKYWDVQDTVVRVRYDECGDWQAMQIEKEVTKAVFSGNSISLLAHTGKRVEVEGTAVSARWTDAGVWQTFVIENGGRAIYSGDAVFLRAHTGMMVDVQGTAVQARWNEWGAWQKLFISKKSGGSGAILPGDAVFFRAHTDKMIDVQNQAVQARYSGQGDWQTFTIEKRADARRLIGTTILI